MVDTSATVIGNDMLTGRRGEAAFLVVVGVEVLYNLTHQHVVLLC